MPYNMIIPSRLSQFKNQQILLLVAGKQEMHIYKVEGNNIEQTTEFKIPTPTYSDNEGHFKVRSRQAGVIRSGSVREIDDRDIITEFKQELQRQVKHLNPTEYDRVYISAPSKTKHEVTKTLPSAFRKKVDAVIVGNYTSDSPLAVLEKVAKSKLQKKPLPIKPEARRILKKSNVARYVIKGKPVI